MKNMTLKNEWLHSVTDHFKPPTPLASDLSPSVISNAVPSRRCGCLQQKRPKRQAHLSGSKGPFSSAANLRRWWGLVFGTSAAVAYKFALRPVSRAHV